MLPVVAGKKKSAPCLWGLVMHHHAPHLPGRTVMRWSPSSTLFTALACCVCVVGPHPPTSCLCFILTPFCKRAWSLLPWLDGGHLTQPAFLPAPWWWWRIHCMFLYVVRAIIICNLYFFSLKDSLICVLDFYWPWLFLVNGCLSKT